MYLLALYVTVLLPNSRLMKSASLLVCCTLEISRTVLTDIPLYASDIATDLEIVLGIRWQKE